MALLWLTILTCACLCPYASAYTTDGTLRCGEGWLYNTDLDQCYRLSVKNDSFENANTICGKYGGELVSIYSDLEYNVVSDIVGEQNVSYIGLQPSSSPPYFRWLDGTNATFTRFVDGVKPAHVKDVCYAFSKSASLAKVGWIVVDCLTVLPFVCKRHPKYSNFTSVNATFGRISSPNYPAPYYADGLAVYNIEVPEHYVIHLNFEFIAIDSRSNISIYENSTLIETITNKSRDYTVKSTTNRLKLRFVASPDGTAKSIGWTASYKAVVPVTMHGSMQSPYYPQNYNDNDTITREILVPDSFGILFTVWDFVGRAGYDYLAILSGSNVHLNLTGQQTAMPFKLRVPNNQATLVWSTNATKPARGFNLTYVADPNLG